MFSAGWTEDLRYVANHIQKMNPDSHLFLVGFSLGANVLTKYLGEEREKTPFVGAVAIANPFNLVATNQHLENFWSGRQYNKHLTKGLVNYAKRYFLSKKI